ncbi:hypothetical protein H0O00_00710 [Candidatus Micrarchaeota archaeon]|nr:hypothetical protein [Candidatus Micrarchaeota archaeon]
MIENARESMGEPAQKSVEKVTPKPDVAETHQAEVLKTTPQPVKEDQLKKVPIKMVGPGPEPDLKIKTDPLPYKGSR